MQPKSLPISVLKTQTNMAPNKENIESSDLNMKQGHPLLDSSNVLTPKIPLAHDIQHDQEEANCQIEKSTVHLESANHRDTTMLDYCKGDFSSRQEIIPPSEKSKLINNMDEQSENVSPVLQQYNIIRPTTPPMAIPVTEIFSPNTVKQVRSTIRTLFPNGPPPPKPVIPVKRHKKGDAPYIVGCTKRRRVPEKKSLGVFKGDKYGITEVTNSFDDEECPSKRKCGKKRQYANWSKSRFNPKSEEIAERLKRNEKVDMMLHKSPNNDTNNTSSYMSMPYKPRPQAFSPLPSTSKDNETIMKNEKHFSESLRYENYNPCEDDDDEELPDIQWELKNISEKKSHHLLQSKDTSKDNETIMKNEKHFSESLRYENYNPCEDDDDEELPDIQWELKNISEKKSHHLLQSKDLVSNEEAAVKSEDLNNNNNNTGPDEVDLCEIQFEKYMPKKEFAVPESTTPTTSNDPIVIDEIDLDNVTETSEPKRVLCEIQDVIETHEIKDDYSSITYDDLYSVPKTTEPVDVDELFKDLENFQRKKKKISSDIITIVDMADLKSSNSQKPRVNPSPEQAHYNDNPAVNLCQEPSVNVEARTTPVPEVAEVIEIPDYVPGSVEPINRSACQASTNDVEFVSETVPENVNNSIYSNSTDDDSSETINSVMARYFFSNIIRDYHNAHSDTDSNDDINQEWHSLFDFFSGNQSTSSLPRSRKRSKKSKKSKGPPQNAGSSSRQADRGQSRTENNENAAPSTNVQTKSPANGERRLGDCPICMENLARGSIASTTCGHVFCLDCIKTCLRTNGKKCPTCRKALKGNGYHLIFL